MRFLIPFALIAALASGCTVQPRYSVPLPTGEDRLDMRPRCEAPGEWKEENGRMVCKMPQRQRIILVPGPGYYGGPVYVPRLPYPVWRSPYHRRPLIPPQF